MDDTARSSVRVRAVALGTGQQKHVPDQVQECFARLVLQQHVSGVVEPDQLLAWRLQAMEPLGGQEAESPNGDVAPDFTFQTRPAWSHVIAQLGAAGMSAENLAKVTTFLSSREFAAINSEARNDFGLDPV